MAHGSAAPTLKMDLCEVKLGDITIMSYIVGLFYYMYTIYYPRSRPGYISVSYLFG